MTIATHIIEGESKHIVQTYKRAHSADMRKTSASEKRRKLLEYIVNFHVQADNQFNEAWRKLIQGIDGLKLF